MRVLIHHRLDRPGKEGAIEVWADDPEPSGAPVITLWFDKDMSSEDLSPTEARTLAALLILAAERQEKAGKP